MRFLLQGPLQQDPEELFPGGLYGGGQQLPPQPALMSQGPGLAPQAPIPAGPMSTFNPLDISGQNLVVPDGVETAVQLGQRVPEGTGPVAPPTMAPADRELGEQRSRGARNSALGTAGVLDVWQPGVDVNGQPTMVPLGPRRLDPTSFQRAGAGGQGGSASFRFGGSFSPPPPRELVAEVEAASAAATQARNDILETQMGQLGAQAGVYDDALDALERASTRYQEVAQQAESETRFQMQRLEGFIQQMSRTRIDPDRFFAQRGEGARFGASIAVGLGVLAQAVNPALQNAALAIIDSAIERDIVAQQSNMQNMQAAAQAQSGLLSHLRTFFNDQTTAVEALRALRLEQARLKMEQLAQQYAVPAMRANAQLLSAQMRAQVGQNLIQAYQRQLQVNFETRAGGSMQNIQRTLAGLHGEWNRLFNQTPQPVRARAADRAGIRRARPQPNEQGQVVATEGPTRGAVFRAPNYDRSSPEFADFVQQVSGGRPVAIDSEGRIHVLAEGFDSEAIGEDMTRRLTQGNIGESIGRPGTPLGQWQIDQTTMDRLAAQGRMQELSDLRRRYARITPIIEGIETLRGIAEEGGLSLPIGERAGRMDALTNGLTTQINVAREQGAISHGDADRALAQIASFTTLNPMDAAFDISLNRKLAALTETVASLRRDWEAEMDAIGIERQVGQSEGAVTVGDE